MELKSLEAWFVTGSQHLYGEEALKRWPRTAGGSSRGSTARPVCRSGWSSNRW